MISQPYNHRAEIPQDDGGPVTFKWHFQRGVLDRRMSGLELSAFVLNHMNAIIGMGLLNHHPRVENEFRAMFVKLATEPKAVLDELLTWIRVEYHEQEDDIIFMQIGYDKPQPEGPVYFT